jgi:sarcosine oxidase, subunit beta
MERVETEVVVVGGGIVGSAAALFLRRGGVPVVLLERDLCGSRSSGVNYGGVRRQGRVPAQLPLAQRSHALWGRLRELTGCDGEYVRSGHIKLARSEADLAALESYAERVRDAGLGLRLLGRRELRVHSPWLGERAVGGSLCPDDGHANPRLVAPAFARAARAAGADVREQTTVGDVEHDGRRFVVRAAGLEVRASYLLNCAGAWAGSIAERFGEPVPLSAGHPLMLVTEPLPAFMDLSLGVEGGGIYARQVARGNCVFGGGHGRALDALRARPQRDAMLQTMRQAAELLPALRHAHVIRCWSGTEGFLPDHQPVLGPSATTPGLLHGFGFSGAGFQTGPAVGDVLAELVREGRSSTPIEAFSITRWTRAARAASIPA